MFLTRTFYWIYLDNSLSTQEALISLFEAFRDRIWIPHQVGLEYYMNKTSVIIEQKEAYSAIRNNLLDYSTKLNIELIDKLKKYQKKHPTIETSHIISKLSAAVEEIISELNAKEKSHPDLLHHDNTAEKLEELFKGKVGQPYTQEN
ncbi:PIN-like domain-containing protein [Brevibacillus sp. 179-C9.3 HS]|uniref:PIN-like domain-containing protein n=1 Tax=unclassified Brevibacillus TaxID=2684853 RepID=UPI0039A2DFE2